MAEVTVKTYKKGDAFAFSYQYGDGGQADTLIADVRPYTGGDVLTTMDVAEDSETAGLYHFTTDADTTDWPANVAIDVWHTDILMHDDTTMVFAFGGAITDGRHRS